MNHDAILVVSFGGPEGPDDVLPFLENVLRGRNVPRERMLEVAGHYQHFGGVSPINQQTRDLIAALEPVLRERGVELPVYWGNRNWHPLLPDTLDQMKRDGVQRALGLVLSAYSSYSGCRQYREDVARAQESVGGDAPTVDKIRVFYNHPLFVQASADRVRTALAEIPEAHVVYTAHSIPESMARGCDYERQLRETCRLVSEAVGVPEDRTHLVYQSRSGRPQDPWLEPDVCDFLGALHGRGVKAVVLMPVGFLSDHMEVLFDLDEEARTKADELGLTMVRAASVGTHPAFVEMLAELVEERLHPSREQRAVGRFGPNHDVCPADCCPAPVRRPS